MVDIKVNCAATLSWWAQEVTSYAYDLVLQDASRAPEWFLLSTAAPYRIWRTWSFGITEMSLLPCCNLNFGSGAIGSHGTWRTKSPQHKGLWKFTCEPNGPSGFWPTLHLMRSASHMWLRWWAPTSELNWDTCWGTLDFAPSVNTAWRMRAWGNEAL